MENLEVAVVFGCDQWKSWDSMRYKGVYTDGVVLRQKLIQWFKEDELEWDGYSIRNMNEESQRTIEWVEDEIMNSSVQELASRIDYVYFEIDRLNTDEDY